jgi:hypothetical protein
MLEKSAENSARAHENPALALTLASTDERALVKLRAILGF